MHFKVIGNIKSKLRKANLTCTALRWMVKRKQRLTYLLMTSDTTRQNIYESLEEISMTVFHDCSFYLGLTLPQENVLLNLLAQKYGLQHQTILNFQPLLPLNGHMKHLLHEKIPNYEL